MDHACSVAKASNSLEVKTRAPFVHLEEFAEDSLKLLDGDGVHGEDLHAKVLGFVYLLWVDGHGEPQGVEENPNHMRVVVGPWHLSAAASRPS